MDRKTIIAFSFATIMVAAGFTGLLYYNNMENNSRTSGNAGRVNVIANKYNLIKANKMHESNINIKSNDTMKSLQIVETFYNGTNSKGYILSLYVNNIMKSSTFIIISNNNTLFHIVPIKSNILKSAETLNISNISTNKSASPNIVTPDAAHLLCFSFYVKFTSGKIKGEALSFNNENTGRLESYIVLGGSISSLVGAVGAKLAGVLAAATLDALKTIAVVFAAMVVTAAIIESVNAYGGYAGIYLGFEDGWFNVPYPIFSYNPLPSSFTDMVNCQPINL